MSLDATPHAESRGVSSGLPSFLGIGAMRAGTTWLDRVLRAHPRIWLPERRKEVHFFDRHHERGPDWYRGFFPPPGETARYAAIGEITPAYLFDPQVPARIQRLLPECRFLAVLRNPVDRAWSHYTRDLRDRAERRSFEECCEADPEILERGRYSVQLERYFRLFLRERFLILIFENTMQEPEPALRRVAEFLEVEARPLLAAAAETEPVNASHQVRFPQLYAGLRRVGGWLHARDLERWVGFAKRSGLPGLFRRGGPAPSFDPETRARLLAQFETEIRALEALLGEDLDVWRHG